MSEPRNNYQTNGTSACANEPLTLVLPPGLSDVVDVTIRKNERQQWTVPTFVLEDGCRCFRFAAPEPGVYRYRADGYQGKINVRRSRGEIPLFKHGPIRVADNHRYLTHADGTPFFYLADTWWYAFDRRMTDDKLQLLLADRATKGFTAIQAVVGIPPESGSSAGSNVFLTNGRLNPSYFVRVDACVEQMVRAGLVPCLVGGWGDQMDRFGLETVKSLWREIVARYAAYPVIFCLTGEVDMPLDQSSRTGGLFRLLKAIARRFLPAAGQLRLTEIFGQSKQTLSSAMMQRLDQWSRVGCFIKSIDAFNRPLTAHTVSTITAQERFPDATWLDINGFQSGHVRSGSHQGRSAMIRTLLNPAHPLTLNLEPCYEGIREQFHAADQRYAFWMSLLAGAKGHAYGAHGLWQISEPWENFQGQWGPSDWITAYRQPGGEQLGNAVRWLGSHLAWWTLRSRPAWIAPHWLEQRPLLPLAATTSSGEILVYFPANKPEQLFRLTLPANQPFRGRWLDPATLFQREHDFVISSEQNFKLPGSKKRTDWLLLLTPRDSGGSV